MRKSSWLHQNNPVSIMRVYIRQYKVGRKLRKYVSLFWGYFLKQFVVKKLTIIKQHDIVYLKSNTIVSFVYISLPKEGLSLRNNMYSCDL